ncbi:MAG: hypothetical protein RI912_1820, partial [Actinomycetota bacterium]
MRSTSRLVRTLLLAATVPVVCSLPSSAGAVAVPAKEICADYFGVVRCVVVTEPAP